MTAPAAQPAAAPLARRLASFAYEGVLLFGVVFGVALVYGAVTQQRHGLQGRSGLDVALFTVIGLYFVWCWSRSGQTLPMKTWHVRLMSRSGTPVSTGRALARYLACWAWFVPPLWASHAAGVASTAGHGAVLLAWIALYAASSLALPDRQFLHDVACGTRLVDAKPAAKSVA